MIFRKVECKKLFCFIGWNKKDRVAIFNIPMKRTPNQPTKISCFNHLKGGFIYKKNSWHPRGNSPWSPWFASTGGRCASTHRVGVSCSGLSFSFGNEWLQFCQSSRMALRWRWGWSMGWLRLDGWLRLKWVAFFFGGKSETTTKKMGLAWK